MTPLQHSLALAAGALADQAPAQAGSAHDPLGLNPPPLLDDRDSLSSEALRAAGALYLQAELEQTGLILVAEALVDQRLRLPLRDPQAADKLDTYHRLQAGFYGQRERNLLFARVFGLGPGVGDAALRNANRDFQARLALLCLALVRACRGLRPGRGLWPADQAALRSAALGLLYSLSSRLYGNTIAAARRIQDQLQRAIDILSHPAVTRCFRARGMWDLLRRVLGQKGPDLGRYVQRGRSGQQVFLWLAESLADFRRPQGTPTLQPDSPVFRHAAAWLQASGLEVA